MPEATAAHDGGQAAVRLERQLSDPPARVWQALTDPKELRRWFPCDVTVAGGDCKVGASITFTFPPEIIDMTLAGQVLVLKEPEVLAFSWGDETLRFELTPQGGGTRLVLINHLHPGAAARNAAGWDDCLDRLEGRPPSPNGWRARFDAYSSAFTPRLGPQEGPPTGYKGDVA